MWQFKIGLWQQSLGLVKSPYLQLYNDDFNWIHQVWSYHVLATSKQKRLKTDWFKIFNYDQDPLWQGCIWPADEVKIILETAGLDIWANQNADNISENTVIKLVHDSEMRGVHESIKVDMWGMSRLTIYRQLKDNFELEKYVKVMKDRKQREFLAKAHMCKLPIYVKTGQYRGMLRDIPKL